MVPGLVYVTVGFGISPGLLLVAKTLSDWTSLPPAVMPVRLTACIPLVFSKIVKLLEIATVGSEV